MCLTSRIQYICQAFKIGAKMSFVCGTVSERAAVSVVRGSVKHCSDTRLKRAGPNPPGQDKYTTKGQFLRFAVKWFHLSNEKGNWMVIYICLGSKESRSLANSPLISAELSPAFLSLLQEEFKSSASGAELRPHWEKDKTQHLAVEGKVNPCFHLHKSAGFSSGNEEPQTFKCLSGCCKLHQTGKYILRQNFQEQLLFLRAIGVLTMHKQ